MTIDDKAVDPKQVEAKQSEPRQNMTKKQTARRMGIQEPDSSDLYGGLSGLTLESDRFHLGHGVVISVTYAHLMSHFVMAFAPAPPGKHHPGPWKSATGGSMEIDVTAELFVPKTCNCQTLDNLNLIWWIVALLRLKAATSIYVPVLSSHSFSAIPSIKDQPVLSTMEVRGLPLRAEEQVNPRVGVPELEWIKSHWEPASALLSDDDFQTAFRAIDFSKWHPNPQLGLLALWGALERLFSPSALELRFRVSANIASYLENWGEARQTLFKRIAKLYDQRSAAAHGTGDYDIVPYQETYAIARRVILRMIEARHVPSRAEQEATLFG
jgi:hypothetical protein